MRFECTEAARRALERAAQLAAEAGAPQVEPLHLLRALILEESRAAEIMAAGGLTVETLDRCHPHEPAEDAPSLAVPEGRAVRNVVAEARRQRAAAGPQGEVGSEHLLSGLASVDSPAAVLLRRHGLDAAQLAERARESSGLAGEPIAVDFRLDEDLGDLDLSGLEDEPAPERAPVSAPEPGGRAAGRTDVLRILDAAANRAREGLRVLEDFVRFTLDDGHLSGLLKEWRHELARALRTVDPAGLLAARDTLHDVGTDISTPAERSRRSLLEVVQANFKRVQEAARTLEEFGKLLSPYLGETLGALRYRLYTLEKAVLLARTSRDRWEGRVLYLLVTQSLCRREPETVVRGALAGGAGIVQVREKSMPDRKLLAWARRVRAWTREAGALFIMNDRPDLALLSDADGVHVGQEELSVASARRIVGPEKLVGVSTHTLEQARRAALDGADYLGVGPVFSTTTKSFAALAGLEFVRQATEISQPWFAIGGIAAGNMAAVLEAGARRIAVSSALCASSDPEQDARDLLRRITAAASHCPTGKGVWDPDVAG